MPRDPITDHFEVSTLGDLQDNGDRLSFYCTETLCGRDLNLDLGKAIEMWGRDRCYIDQRWGIKCAGCGSNKIGLTVNPAPYGGRR